MPTTGRPASPGRIRLEFSGITIKTALVIGFGVTAAVWLWSGYELTQRMAHLESETSAINRRYTRAQESLSSVRTQILLASVAVRDALLDPDPATFELKRSQFEGASRVVEDALAQYVPVIDSLAELGHIESLRSEVAGFERAMIAVFGSGAAGPDGQRSARLVLRQEIVPKRETLVAMSDEVQSLNRAAFVNQRLQTARLYRDAERQAWRRLGGALTVSLTIGLLAAVYAHRLETRVKQQRLRDLELTHDLFRLSRRLATAQEDERRTISRELHDEVGQCLTALKVELSLARRTPDLPPAVASRLEDAREMTNRTLDAVRNLTHLLHPPVLDDLGLVVAMRGWLDGFSGRNGIETELVQEGMEARLAPDVETALYRIMQEALTNVAKHAKARRCRVHLISQQATVRVTLEDDGVGFDAAPLKPLTTNGGLGLIGIRERVAQLDGSMQVESAPGRGTRLIIELPARLRAESRG